MIKTVYLDCGDTKLAFKLPDSATVVRYGETYQDLPTVDLYAATKEVLQNP